MLSEFRQYLFNLLSSDESLSGVVVLLDQIHTISADGKMATTEIKWENALAEKGWAIVIHQGMIKNNPGKVSAAAFTLDITVPVEIFENSTKNAELEKPLDINTILENLLRCILRALQTNTRPPFISSPIPDAESIPVGEYAEGIFSTTLFLTCLGRIVNNPTPPPQQTQQTP